MIETLICTRHIHLCQADCIGLSGFCSSIVVNVAISPKRRGGSAHHTHHNSVKRPSKPEARAFSIALLRLFWLVYYKPLPGLPLHLLCLPVVRILLSIYHDYSVSKRNLDYAFFTCSLSQK